MRVQEGEIWGVRRPPTHDITIHNPIELKDTFDSKNTIKGIGL